MPMIFRLACLLSYLLFNGALAALAASAAPPEVPQSLPALFNSASLIVAGEILSTSDNGSFETEWYGNKTRVGRWQSIVKVDRIYKGSVQGEGIEITYLRPEGNLCHVSRCPSLSVGEHDLFFLGCTNSECHLIDLGFGKSGKFPISRLHGETLTGLHGMEADLIAGLADKDQDLRDDAIALLGATTLEEGIGPLKSLAQNSSLKQRALIYISLLRLGDVTKLSEMGSIVELQTKDSWLLSVQNSLLNQIEIIQDPNAVPVLKKWLCCSSIALRQASLKALIDILGPAANPLLVSLLDDREESIRFDAVCGLATIQNVARPSAEEFKQYEAKYIAEWKSWWDVAGKKSNNNGSSGLKGP